MNGVSVIAIFLACRDPRVNPGNPILTCQPGATVIVPPLIPQDPSTG
jgi:hypothetical protein